MQHELPESWRVSVISPGKAGNNTGLGVGAHCNDEGPPIALQHLAATQQQRVLVRILQHILCLTCQLTLVHSTTTASIWSQIVISLGHSHPLNHVSNHAWGGEAKPQDLHNMS